MTKRIMHSFSLIIIALVLSAGAVQAQTRDAAATPPSADAASQSGSRFFELLTKKRPALGLISGRGPVRPGAPQRSRQWV